MKFTHRIRVLGRELQVRSHTPPDRVREIEAFVNSKIGEASDVIKGGDLQVVAILALMNLAEDYLSFAAGQEKIKKDQAEKLAALVQKIEAILQV